MMVRIQRGTITAHVYGRGMDLGWTIGGDIIYIHVEVVPPYV